MILRYRDQATGRRPGAALLTKTRRKENKMPQGKHIRISNRLYEHLKSMGGVMSKNLDKIVFGNSAPTDLDNMTVPAGEKLDVDKLLEGASTPDSAMLYSAILLAWREDGGSVHIEDWEAPRERAEILKSVFIQLEYLVGINSAIKDIYPAFFYEMDAYKSKFEITMDNRITNLVRAKILRREDGKLWLNGKPNSDFINNVYAYYQGNIHANIKTRGFVQKIYSDPATTDNEAFPI